MEVPTLCKGINVGFTALHAAPPGNYLVNGCASIAVQLLLGMVLVFGVRGQLLCI